MLGFYARNFIRMLLSLSNAEKKRSVSRVAISNILRFDFGFCSVPDTVLKIRLIFRK
jgi:hypothetical protein